MDKKTHLGPIFLLGGSFLILDQSFKFFAHSLPNFSYYLLKTWIGWEYLPNPGVAFGIPLPNFLAIAITPLILAGLVIYWLKTDKKNILFYFGCTFIMAGAISNLIDRILFNITIDYLRFFTSVFNLSDVLIVVGTGILIWNEIKTK